MRSTRIALAATAAAGVLAAAAIPTAPAVAASQPLVASLNTAADPQYPQDQQRFSDTGLVQTDGSGGAYLFASGWSLDLRPAADGTIRPGLYTGVSNAAQTSAHAYADLAVGLFDEGFSGDVDVLDWVAGANGVPTRFDIVFRTGPYATSAQGFFGEMRLGEDASTSPDLAAMHLEWAPTPVGGTRIEATEWIHNRSSAAIAVGTAQVSGDAKADYVVGSNGCSGRTLAAGAKCSFTVGFSPTAAGPRIAALTVPIGAASRTVSLAGSAPLGTTSFTTSGNDAIDEGATHTWTEGGSTQFTQGTFGDGFVFGFTAPYALYDASKSFAYFVGGPHAAVPTVGTHSTSWLDLATDSADVAESGSQFGGPTGTETVKRFDVDALGRVLDADIDFTLVDVPGTTMTGHLRYRARTDYTPPATPTVSISDTAAGTSVRWTVPSDAVRSIVRVGMGSVAPADPTAGLPVAAGTATSATLTGLTAHQQYTVAVFAVDAAGNVSTPATTTVTG